MSKTGLQCLRTYIEAQEDYNKKPGLNKHPYAQYFFRTLLGSVLSSHGLINNSVVTGLGTVGMTTLSLGGTTITASATELNYVDGVTGNIQTALDSKATKAFAIAQAVALG